MVRKFLGLFKSAFTGWQNDQASRMGAALAFYTVFSLAPLLVLVIAVSNFLAGNSYAEDQIIRQISELTGNEGAQAVKVLIAAARHHPPGIFPTVVGILTLLVGATGTLAELQDGLNRVWAVRKRDRGILITVKHRVLSFGLILGTAFLLLVSLIVSTILVALGSFLSQRYPVGQVFWQIIDVMTSWAAITMLFALIYKGLPETPIRWGDVWMGATTASMLFTAGKYLVSFYIAKTAITSTYGAAGSFVVVLLWVYYSALLLYYGAEFTKVYANRVGSRTHGS